MDTLRPNMASSMKKRAEAVKLKIMRFRPPDDMLTVVPYVEEGQPFKFDRDEEMGEVNVPLPAIEYVDPPALPQIEYPTPPPTLLLEYKQPSTVVIEEVQPRMTLAEVNRALNISKPLSTRNVKLADLDRSKQRVKAQADLSQSIKATALENARRPVVTFPDDE